MEKPEETEIIEFFFPFENKTIQSTRRITQE